jgi:hypothetical protein
MKLRFFLIVVGYLKKNYIGYKGYLTKNDISVLSHLGCE